MAPTLLVGRVCVKVLCLCLSAAFLSGSQVRIPRETQSITGNTVGNTMVNDSDLDNEPQYGSEEGLTRMLNELELRYDSRIRPKAAGPPVIVLSNVYVIGGFSTVAATMDFNLMVFIRQRWNDPRLKFEGNANQSFSVNPQLLNKLWVPDMFFPNEKDGKLHQLTVRNEALRIYPNGDVMLSMRVSLTLACNMNLRYYPMDVQLCYLTMESYGFRTHDLMFHWNDEEPVVIDNEIEIAEFKDPVVKTVEFNKTYATGSFSSLRVYFVLYRVYDFHVVQTFVPTCVIVIISWLSFWLNPESVPARVSLGITTLLTITSQAAGVRASLPRVSYVKAIDIWMTTCLVFVFAALTEYALINYLLTEKKRQEDKQEEAAKKRLSSSSASSDGGSMKMAPLGNSGSVDVGVLDTSGEDEGRVYFISIWMTQNMSPVKVDRASRVIFPVVFLLFNIFYWPICLASYYGNLLEDIKIGG